MNKIKSLKIILIIVILAPIFLFFIIPNSKRKDTIKDQNITLVNTIYGGCNNTAKDSGRETKGKVGERGIGSQQEYSRFSIYSDTLSAFFSIHYLCCTPFKAISEYNDDTLVFKIIDTCKDPYDWCYCRCECYYTFDFKFVNYSDSVYDYKVILYDPKAKSPEIIEKGKFDPNLLGNYSNSNKRKHAGKSR